MAVVFAAGRVAAVAPAGDSMVSLVKEHTAQVEHPSWFRGGVHWGDQGTFRKKVWLPEQSLEQLFA